MIHDWKRIPRRLWRWAQHGLLHDQYDPQIHYYDCFTCRRICRMYKLYPPDIMRRRAEEYLRQL